MRKHYTEYYNQLISEAGANTLQRWRARREALMQYKRGGSLLDLGCSSGSFLKFLKGGPWKLYGIEISAKSAEIAEERSGAQIFVGDVLDAPFLSESFDVITCFDVLEHLYEPRKVLAKVREWLKPDGIFYILAPNVESAEAHIFGSYWCGLELPRHLYHYSPFSLRHLANSVGLHEISLVTRRNAAIGVNFRYLFDDFCRAIGILRTPQAQLGPPSLSWKVVRKLVRMSILPILLALAPLAGSGESIHAFFRRDLE